MRPLPLLQRGFVTKVATNGVAHLTGRLARTTGATAGARGSASAGRWKCEKCGIPDMTRLGTGRLTYTFNDLFIPFLGTFLNHPNVCQYFNWIEAESENVSARLSRLSQATQPDTARP